MMSLPKSNLRILTFKSNLVDSYGKVIPATTREHNLVFNITQISQEEVEKLVDNGMYKFDNRVVDIPTCELNYLFDKKI